MPRRRFIFDPPERFVTGTIGEPGQRTFFLQARDGGRVVSVALEKVQVAVLADRLGQLLVELDKRGIAPEDPIDSSVEDTSPLDEPLNEAFRAGALTLGWDGDAELILVEARAESEDGEPIDPDEDDDEDEDGPDLLRVRMTADAARSSSSAPFASWPPGVRRARSAASRSIRRATSARAATATTSTDQPANAGPGDRPAHPARGRDRDRRPHRRLVEQRDAGHGHVPARIRSRPNRSMPSTSRPPASGRSTTSPTGRCPAARWPAWHVSEALGWGIVPPTVLRDGPFGEGMVQEYIELDLTVDVVEMIVSDDPRLRRIAAFDAAVNNTDRKGGHLLPVDGGAHVFGVDHGVCFSPVPKLRTVLWGWRGDPFDDEELAGFDRLCGALAGDLGGTLRRLLSSTEVEATRRRVEGLLATRRWPMPSPHWPAVPWPPF